MALLLSACKPKDPIEAAETAQIQDISVSVSPLVPTVLEVSFTTSAAGRAWVEFGPDESLGWSSSPDGGGVSHHHALVGMPGFTEVHLQIRAEIDGEVWESGAVAVENGQNAAETPLPVVTIDDYSPPGHAVLLLTLFSPRSHLVLMDFSGEIIWSYAPDQADFQSLMALPSWEGGRFLVNRCRPGWRDTTLREIDLTGVVASEQPLPGGHHSFEQLPDGTLAWLAPDIRETEEHGLVAGDQLIERAPGGEERAVFSTWDHLTVAESATWDLPYADGARDWTHASGVTYDTARGTYLLTAAGVDVIAEIERDGAVPLLAGGVGSPDTPVAFDPPGAAFGYPHGAHWAADGDLLVFSTAYGQSLGMRYRPEGATLAEEARYGADSGWESLLLGEVQELPDGNLLISWGSLGVVQVLSPAGAVLWEAHMPVEHFVGQIHLLADPYAGREQY